MMFYNHLIGGVVFSGTFSAISGQNIFESKTALAVAVVASLAPDIDNPSSPIGRILRPISRYIHSNYGHRSVTHSLVFLIVSTLIFAIFSSYWIVWFWAYFSHCIFDMLTLQGVLFFYPFLKNNCVMPQKPEFRFRTGDKVAETISFCTFLVLGMSLYPLMSQGFWTSYNSLYGTQKHLASEFQKSKDLLEVTYNYEIGSQVYTGKGFCIDANEKKTILLEGSKFLIIDENLQKVKSVTFQHTKKPFFFQNQTFINITADSLNNLVSSRPIVSIDVQCTNTAKVIESGKEQTFKTFSASYPSQLLFLVKDSTYNTKPFQYVPSVTATLKRNLIKTIRDEYALRLSQYNDRQNQLQKLLNEDTKDAVLREENMRKISKLKNETPPELDQIRINQLEFEAQIAESQEAQNVQLARSEHERREREKFNMFQKSTFSGVLRFVDF